MNSLKTMQKSIRRVGCVKSTISNGIGYWSVWNSQEFITVKMLQFCTLKKIAVWMIMPIGDHSFDGIQRGKTIK
ncbi:MAG: hypothetical protein IPI10_16255 [Bacteroidetes bacterium]|nr:hypothetical protein [Bacteroidota bacterium]